MKRRDFLKICSVGLGGMALGSIDILPKIFRASESFAAVRTANLSITDALVEMVDLTQVYSWVFADNITGPRFPGPVIFANQGDTLNINVTNELDEDHAFSIPGVIDSGIISPGATKNLSFNAPAAGTYLYLDPLNAPVNRVMGLHGILVVRPIVGNTPYSSPTSQVQQLFNDLGTTDMFPGQSWNDGHSRIWVFHSIDPTWNNKVLNHEDFTAAQFSLGFTPRYFTINGKSGYFSAHDNDIRLHGDVGEPMLIRVINTGMATHSPHWHANHVYVLAENGVINDNVFLIDAMMIKPTDRKDVLFPFIKPPDIPESAWPPFEETFPLKYPMHCHFELSQTAAGGNYPQGLVTDIEFF